MSHCPIDHSVEDVLKKLAEQKPFLRKDLYDKSVVFLQEEREQVRLNELFHLLKKYDLATQEEREERHKGFEQLLK